MKEQDAATARARVREELRAGDVVERSTMSGDGKAIRELRQRGWEIQTTYVAGHRVWELLSEPLDAERAINGPQALYEEHRRLERGNGKTKPAADPAQDPIWED